MDSLGQIFLIFYPSLADADFKCCKDGRHSSNIAPSLPVEDSVSKGAMMSDVESSVRCEGGK